MDISFTNIITTTLTEKYPALMKAMAKNNGLMYDFNIIIKTCPLEFIT